MILWALLRAGFGIVLLSTFIIDHFERFVRHPLDLERVRMLIPNLVRRERWSASEM